MISIAGDRTHFPLNFWKIDKAGNIGRVPVVTIEPMYYYESTGLFSVVLTIEDIKEIYEAYTGITETTGDYDDLDEILAQEFGE